MPGNIVYFLGAGASKSFGYPLTGEIIPMIMERLIKHDLFQISNSRKTKSEIKQEKNLLSYLYLLYPGLNGKKKFDDINSIPNITEILSLVDHFCFYNIPPHPKIADDTLTYFRNLLNRAVGELLLEIDNLPYSNEEKALLSKFFNPIRNEKRSSNVTLITSNYDLIVDREFKNQLRQNRVDYGISYRNVTSSELVYRNPDPLFSYYKLHGSLNWAKCDLCGQYYINPEGSIIHQCFKEALLDENTCICSKNLRLKSVLVTPSLVRDIRDANLLQIWKCALEKIRTADQLIFIGYSLPPEDLALKSIIIRGVNGRSKERPLEVIVVQQGDAAKNNYINLFGKNIQYHSRGLQEYLR